MLSNSDLRLRKATVFWIILFFMFASIIQASTQVSVVYSAMYGEQPFVREQSSFSLDDTFYCVFDVVGLAAGKHTMRVDWITPTGILEQRSEYDFVVQDKVKKYRLFSWLQVWQNGPVTRLMTGQDYKIKYYGLWSVLIYIDGVRLARQEFDAV